MAQMFTDLCVKPKWNLEQGKGLGEHWSRGAMMATQTMWILDRFWKQWTELLRN